MIDRGANRAAGEYRQVIDIYVSPRRDVAAARRVLADALSAGYSSTKKIDSRPR